MKTATTKSVASAMQTKNRNNDHFTERNERFSNQNGSGNGIPPVAPTRPGDRNNNAGLTGIHNQFVYPAKNMTALTNSSNNSPMRNYSKDLGLPMTSAQYTSSYAVPQSSSGSSASAGFKPEPRHRNQLHLTHMSQPAQQSPRHLISNNSVLAVNSNLAPLPPPPQLPPIYSQYFQQKQNHGVRRDGHANMPNGDEMSTELW